MCVIHLLHLHGHEYTKHFFFLLGLHKYAKINVLPVLPSLEIVLNLVKKQTGDVTHVSLGSSAMLEVHRFPAAITYLCAVIGVAAASLPLY